MIEAIVGTIIVLGFMCLGKTSAQYEKDRRNRPRI